MNKTEKIKQTILINKKREFSYFSVGVIGSIGQLQVGLRFHDKGKRRFLPNFKKHYYYSFPPYMTPEQVQVKEEREKLLAK